jgi:hypothetical protein
MRGGSEVDPASGLSLAAFCQEQLTARAAQVGKTAAELRLAPGCLHPRRKPSGTSI